MTDRRRLFDEVFDDEEEEQLVKDFGTHVVISKGEIQFENKSPSSSDHSSDNENEENIERILDSLINYCSTEKISLLTKRVGMLDSFRKLF